MAINKVGLRETLEALRVELIQFVVEQSKEGKGGLKFWVVEMGGGVTNKDTITHRIKIPLKPIGEDGGPIKTASDDIPD
ncbi:MAG: hypothetical protein GPJ35_01965 [Microcystis aeruginosa G11-09]|nr:hypothetical protein [Microcystis aeruginosa G11-09]